MTRITWTGGEPSLVPSLPALIEMCHQCNIKTVLTTHGLSLTPKILAAFSSATDSVRLSIDGLEKTHNEIRGGHFFQRTMSSIARLISLGIKTEVNISVMQRNVREIPQLLKILTAAGVSKVVLLSLMQRESAKVNNLHPGSQTEFAQLQNEIVDFQETNSLLEVILYDYYDPNDTYIVVESDGEIILCSELGDKSMGQILSADGTELLSAALAEQTLAHKKPFLQLQFQQ